MWLPPLPPVSNFRKSKYVLGEVKAYRFVAIWDSSPAQSPERSHFSGCCVAAAAVCLGSISCVLTISWQLASKYLTWLLHIGKNSCRKPKTGLVYFCPRRCHWRARKSAGLVIVLTRILTAASWSGAWRRLKAIWSQKSLQLPEDWKAGDFCIREWIPWNLQCCVIPQLSHLIVCDKTKWFLGGGGKRFMSLEVPFYNIPLKEYVYLLALHFIPVVSTLHYKAQPLCFFCKVYVFRPIWKR